MKFSWFFEEISSQASPQTLAVTKHICLGHFTWKIFSSNFQLRFWTIFLLNFVDFLMLFWSKLDGYVRTQHGSTSKTYKNHCIFQRNWAKIWFEIGVGILMKIFFMRNVPNKHVWSLRVSAVMFETIFPRKTMKFSCFFMFVDYCMDSYSNSMPWSSALLKHVLFARARSRK